MLTRASVLARQCRCAPALSASISSREFSSDGKVKEWIKHNYRHFNAATVVDAAEVVLEPLVAYCFRVCDLDTLLYILLQGWTNLLDNGGKMMLTMAGAMSTAEMGVSIAELIRQDKIHIISCTGANLEEDFFNLIAHNSYCRVPHWRSLSKQDEMDLLKQGFNRVTDTCIPEEVAMRRIESELLDLYKELCAKNEHVSRL
jgi:deoxyhypusine synthase